MHAGLSSIPENVFVASTFCLFHFVVPAIIARIFAVPSSIIFIIGPPVRFHLRVAKIHARGRTDNRTIEPTASTVLLSPAMAHSIDGRLSPGAASCDTKVSFERYRFWEFAQRTL